MYTDTYTEDETKDTYLNPEFDQYAREYDYTPPRPVRRRHGPVRIAPDSPLFTYRAHRPPKVSAPTGIDCDIASEAADYRHQAEELCRRAREGLDPALLAHYLRFIHP